MTATSEWPGSCVTDCTLLPGTEPDMLWAKARSTILAPLFHTLQPMAARPTSCDPVSLRAALVVAVYFGMLDLVIFAAYALWRGPQRFGFAESWPLVTYFV